VRYQGGLEQAGLDGLLDEETDRRAHVVATGKWLESNSLPITTIRLVITSAGKYLDRGVFSFDAWSHRAEEEVQ